jgi:hypothetical protein
MRATGYLVVAGTFVVAALLAYAVIRAIGWQAHDFALVVAAIVSTQAGAIIWHRQDPNATVASVKLRLGMLLSVTCLVFTLAFQATSGWLRYPEVTAPIATLGCFLFPYALVGSMWKALSQARPPGNQDS